MHFYVPGSTDKTCNAVTGEDEVKWASCNI